MELQAQCVPFFLFLPLIVLLQQFKGNYLIRATVDGKNRKYIIRKGTQEHEKLTSVGLANVTDEMMKEMVEKFII